MGWLEKFEKIGSILQSFVIAVSAALAVYLYMRNDEGELRVQTSIETRASEDCAVHLLLGFENVGDRTWTAHSAKAMMYPPNFSPVVTEINSHDARNAVASQTTVIDQVVKSGESGAISLHLLPKEVILGTQYSVSIALKILEEENQWLRVEQDLVRLGNCAS
jgi:hypothetical protein